jgi:hypothetical protein
MEREEDHVFAYLLFIFSWSPRKHLNHPGTDYRWREDRRINFQKSMGIPIFFLKGFRLGADERMSDDGP